MTGTFKMTVQEVTDKINNILQKNKEAKVLKIRLPKDEGAILSMDLSWGIFLDELIEISETFGDDSMLVSSNDDFDGISLYMRPADSFWEVEGGNQ